MIHWGKIFCFLHGPLGMVRKNSLRSRMVYDPLGKNLLFSLWFTKEFLLILPTRGCFINRKVPGGPNPIHNPVSAWIDPLQNNRARINHKVPIGPYPIHNPVNAWSNPLQNKRARVNRKVPGGPNLIHNPVSAWATPLQVP